MTVARGFPAFAPRRGRGRSWWARAFLAAVADTAQDADLLRAGRRLATSGRVGPITVSPGRIAAGVDDPVDAAGYRAVVRLPVLGDADWDRFDEQVAAVAGHLAALLDGTLSRTLVRAADAVDVALLPAVGELESDCDCPDWGDPCRHAAAVCEQAAWLLDEDPLVLLLLRGRSRAELLASVSGARPRAPDPAAQPAAIAELVRVAAARARALLDGAP